MGIEQDILEIYKKFMNIETKTLKYNLLVAVQARYSEFESRDALIETTGLTRSTFQSMVNVSHPSRVMFENIVIICGTLNIPYDELLVESEVSDEKFRGNMNLLWTVPRKKRFVEYYKENGLDATAKKFELSIKTTMLYYDRFSVELENNSMLNGR